MSDQGFSVNQLVLEKAAAWIGTPYRHGASRKFVGCDCLGLIRGIWREIYGGEPEATGIYAADWAEVTTGDPLIEAASRHMQAIKLADMTAGDLLVFRWQHGVAAKHLGVLSAENRFIHAYEGHRVMASSLVPQWRRRIAAVFRFPEQ